MSPSAASSASASWRASCTGSRDAVAELELEADLEAEVHDAHDLRLLGAGLGLGGDADVVRAHEARRRSRATGPRKPMTNSLAGRVVELPRGADLLDRGPRS